MNQFGNATLLMLNLKAIDPLGNSGDLFYQNALHVSKKLTAKYKIGIYWTGIPAASMDAIDGANDHFLGTFFYSAFCCAHL